MGTASEIAYKVGFNSPAYFTKCFHDYFGFTPGEVSKKKIIKNKIPAKRVVISFRKWTWRTATVIGFTIVLIWVVAYILNGKKIAKNISNSAKSIAVLPFENITGDSTYAFLELGISELLIGVLSASEELRVIDNNTLYDVFNYTDKVHKASMGPAVAGEIARKLQVDSYITGSYFLVDSSLRINLKLIDTKSKVVLKPYHVEGIPKSYISMTGALALNIKNFLEIKIIEEGSEIEPATCTTTSPDAYKYYILGMEEFWKHEGSPSNYFEKAIKLDSTFTSAYLFLSLGLSSGAHFIGAKKAMSNAYKGKDKLSRKMQLWLEALMSQYVDKNPYKTINYFEQVAEIDPLSRINWFWLGQSYNRIENYEDALLSFQQIKKLNKQIGKWEYHDFFLALGYTYRKLGKHKKAQKVYKEGIQIFPNSRLIVKQQAICALMENDTSSALQYINQFRSSLTKLGIYPESLKIGYLGHIYRNAGQTKEAERLYRLALEIRLESGPAKDTTSGGNNLFWYYATLGRLLIDYDINVEEGMEYLHIAEPLSIEAYSSCHPYISEGFGYGYYKQKRYKDALQALKKVEREITFYDHTIHKNIQELEKVISKK